MFCPCFDYQWQNYTCITQKHQYLFCDKLEFGRFIKVVWLYVSMFYLNAFPVELNDSRLSRSILNFSVGASSRLMNISRCYFAEQNCVSMFMKWPMCHIMCKWYSIAKVRWISNILYNLNANTPVQRLSSAYVSQMHICSTFVWIVLAYEYYECDIVLSWKDQYAFHYSSRVSCIMHWYINSRIKYAPAIPNTFASHYYNRSKLLSCN